MTDPRGRVSRCAADRAANAGKLPVVEYKGSKMEKIGKGTTRIPQFAIVNWIDRPAGMDSTEQAEPEEAYVAPAPRAPAVRAAAPVATEDEMF